MILNERQPVSSRINRCMKNEALGDLQALLYTAEKWVKVHVAEFLLWENYYSNEVRNVFLAEEERFGDTAQYRIGIWRVLAQAASHPDERKKWANKIVAAYGDTHGADRLHAIESLAKLRHPVIDATWLRQADGQPLDAYFLYHLWNLAYHMDIEKKMIVERLIAVLEEENESDHNRVVASYILRAFPDMPSPDWKRIARVSRSIGDNPSVKANLLATLWITQPLSTAETVIEDLRKEMSACATGNAGVYQLLMALSNRQTSADREEVKRIFGRLRDSSAPEYDADLHATAAYAVISFY